MLLKFILNTIIISAALASYGNNGCKNFCQRSFGYFERPRTDCIRDARHRRGTCYKCGPMAISGHPEFCRKGTRTAACCTTARPKCVNGVCQSACTTSCRCQYDFTLASSDLSDSSKCTSVVPCTISLVGSNQGECPLKADVIFTQLPAGWHCAIRSQKTLTTTNGNELTFRVTSAGDGSTREMAFSNAKTAWSSAAPLCRSPASNDLTCMYDFGTTAGSRTVVGKCGCGTNTCPNLIINSRVESGKQVYVVTTALGERVVTAKGSSADTAFSDAVSYAWTILPSC